MLDLKTKPLLYLLPRTPYYPSMWACMSPWGYGYGETPQDAYSMWLKNSQIGMKIYGGQDESQC
jgi:hypothetical protein